MFNIIKKPCEVSSQAAIYVAAFIQSKNRIHNQFHTQIYRLFSKPSTYHGKYNKVYYISTMYVVMGDNRIILHKCYLLTLYNINNTTDDELI